MTWARHVIYRCLGERGPWVWYCCRRCYLSLKWAFSVPRDLSILFLCPVLLGIHRLDNSLTGIPPHLGGMGTRLAVFISSPRRTMGANWGRLQVAFRNPWTKEELLYTVRELFTFLAISHAYRLVLCTHSGIARWVHRRPARTC